MQPLTKNLSWKKMWHACRQIGSKQEVELFASSMDMKYMETSALSNINVEKVFKDLAESLKQRFVKAFLDKYLKNDDLK